MLQTTIFETAQTAHAHLETFLKVEFHTAFVSNAAFGHGSWTTTLPNVVLFLHSFQHAVGYASIEQVPTLTLLLSLLSSVHPSGNDTIFVNEVGLHESSRLPEIARFRT